MRGPARSPHGPSVNMVTPRTADMYEKAISVSESAQSAFRLLEGPIRRSGVEGH